MKVCSKGMHVTYGQRQKSRMILSYLNYPIAMAQISLQRELLDGHHYFQLSCSVKSYTTLSFHQLSKYYRLAKLTLQLKTATTHIIKLLC